MIRRILPLIALLLLVGPWSHWARAQSIPTAIPYTGVIAVDGIPHNAPGYFKFAIVTRSGATPPFQETTKWSNDRTSADGSEPNGSVTVQVSNGLYAVELGNQGQPIPTDAFDAASTYLKVWFSDNSNGPFELLQPDRQLVSVPYAYQAEKAKEVSGTGAVVKSIDVAGSTGGLLTDAIVLQQSGNVELQRNGNTITIVGRSNDPGAANDIACPQPCVSSAEIVGPLTDALIPDLGTLSGTLTDTQIPDLGTLSGTLTDGQIPSSIARDTEVDDGIARHTQALNAHAFTSISGALSEAQIPVTIARDSEVEAAVANATATNVVCTTPCVSPAEISGPLTDALIPDLGQLSGAVTDSQIPDSITRDSEAARDVACATPCVSSGEISGPLTDALIPDTIARVGQAAGDVVCATPCIASAEISGPLAEALIPNTIARVGQAAEDVVCATPCIASAEISGVLASTQIPATIDHPLTVTGTVTVTALAASYDRPPAGTFTVSAGGTQSSSVQCASGRVLGGGFDHDDQTGLVAIVGSWPSADNAWSVRAFNGTAGSVEIRVYAVCAAIQ